MRQNERSKLVDVTGQGELIKHEVGARRVLCVEDERVIIGVKVELRTAGLELLDKDTQDLDRRRTHQLEANVLRESLDCETIVRVQVLGETRSEAAPLGEVIVPNVPNVPRVHRTSSPGDPQKRGPCGVRSGSLGDVQLHR